jgi:hypothetical protein
MTSLLPVRKATGKVPKHPLLNVVKGDFQELGASKSVSSR